MNRNEEEFGVIINAKIDSFKRKMKELVSLTQTTGKQIEKNINLTDAILPDSLTKKWKSQGLRVVSNELQDVAIKEEEIGKSSINFDKATKTMKKFSLSIFGARTAFSLLMKYQSAYLQFNSELQYQNELATNTIALSLAPAFKALGEVLKYVAVTIGIVSEALFNINVFGQVATNGVNNYNKSLSKTKTLLSGIDEITNLSTGDGGSALGEQFNSLANYQTFVNEMKEKLSWLSNWIKENKSLITWVVGGLALGKLLSLMTGISGIGALVVSAAVLVSGAEKLHKMLEELKELKKIREENSKQINNDTLNMMNEFDNIYDKIKNMEKGTDEYNQEISRAKIVWSQIEAALRDNDEMYEQNKEKIDDIAEKLSEMTGEDFKVKLVLALDTKNAETQGKSWFQRTFGGLFSTISSASGGGAARGFAKGLDYVPYDEFPAVLHKGEAVVPAKYNPTIHSQGNEYTNSLLETLVTKLDDLSSKPNVFEIDGRQFASATYSLYKNEETRQNYNGKVSVRNG